MIYIYPILIFAALGLFSGVLLTVASKALAVHVDERTAKISEALPQANCGACGYAGCSAYADAIVSHAEKTNLCKPGGADVSVIISSIMGTEAMTFVPEVSVVHCGGDCDSTSRRYEFDGINTCVAAKRFYGGGGTCRTGCIGLGDCARVCTETAISLDDGVAVIDRAKCLACGKCVTACPQGLIALQPITKHFTVACSSTAPGKETRQVCKKGCIGCKICEKKCLAGAITVTDNHASIDYTKCTGCGQCYNACPTGAIKSCSANAGEGAEI